MSARPEHILFVFLDGVGLGEADPEKNPFGWLALPAFERMAQGQGWTASTKPVREDRRLFQPIDATLGVPGLPQSGTGQATLFTGVNCAQVAGRHYGPFPHSATRPVLAERNVFRQVMDLGLNQAEPAAFANAYPQRFFAHVRQRDRWTVTTRCCLDAGLEIRDEQALLAGRGLAANLTGQGFPGQIPVPAIGEEEAAARLSEIARRHAFTLFEYYLTDKAGHSQDAAQAERVLASLDRFFGALLDVLPEEVLLVVSSDHGNMEDLSVKTHTLNPVPLAARGRGAGALGAVEDLTGVTPVLVRLLDEAWTQS